MKFKDYICIHEEKYGIEKRSVYAFTSRKNKELSCKKISTFFFDISGEDLIGNNEQGYLFQVVIVWRDATKGKNWEKESLISARLSQGRARGWKLICEDLKEELDEINGKYDTEFLYLCQRYLKYYLCEIIEKYEKSCCVGWIENGDSKEYCGITTNGECLGYNYPELFKDLHRREQEEAEIFKETDFSGLLDWLMSDYNIFGIFAYSIHSLFYYFGGTTKKDKENAFAICIYGKDNHKVCTVANLLSNCFEYESDKPEKLVKHSYISCSSVEGTDAMFYRIESVPMIVRHKSNRITKNTSIVKTFHRRRLAGKIGFFPVYLSQNAMNADEVIDFCVDGISIFEEFSNLKKKINLLYKKFVLYLHDLEKKRNEFNHIKNDMDLWYITHENRYRRAGIFDPDDIERCEVILLNIACKGFAFSFLREIPVLSEIASEFEAISDYYFPVKECLNASQKNGTMNTIGLIGFAEFIKKTLAINEAERTFLCIEQCERRGGEKCIYLDIDKAYKEFQTICERQGKTCMDVSSLKKQLRDKGLLKMRTSSTQYCMQREISFKGKSKKYTVLVILQEAFMQLECEKEN